MKSGTATKQKYYNIKAIYENLPLGSTEALLAFHALLAVTLRLLYTITPKNLEGLFEHHQLLLLIGEGVLTEQKKKAVEKFICMMYKLDLASVDEARVVLYFKAGKPEALPQTSDALSVHMLRAHCQTLVWKQAHCSEPLFPDPVTMGWKRNDDIKLRPVLMIQDLIPKACCEMISCSCRIGCTTCRCSCKLVLHKCLWLQEN
jgi:hypothetical protein